MTAGNTIEEGNAEFDNTEEGDNKTYLFRKVLLKPALQKVILQKAIRNKTQLRETILKNVSVTEAY